MDQDIRQRMRRRDYTQEILRTRPAPPPPPPQEQPKRPRRKKKRQLIVATIILAILLVSLGVWRLLPAKPTPKPASPVPQSISAAVKFPVYYPDQKKLPAGYTLDKTSFSSGNGAVELVVLNGPKKIIFTEQAKPSDQDLQGFVTTRMPLHNTISTSVGTATIGAISSNAFVSLPTNDETWILISAPSNINQTQLKQILDSITR